MVKPNIFYYSAKIIRIFLNYDIIVKFVVLSLYRRFLPCKRRQSVVLYVWLMNYQPRNHDRRKIFGMIGKDEKYDY